MADRSNNRVQILDSEMRFVDDWRHFGRPSGIAISSDDVLYVSDSESSKRIAGAVRNPGWKNGVRIGSARDGSLLEFIDGTDPEGLGADGGRQRVHRAHARPARRPSPAAEVG